MTTASVSSATPVKLSSSGNRDFCAIYNNGGATLYVCFDGSAGANGANLTAANGFPIPSGQSLFISNDGNRNVYNQEIWGISGGATLDVRIQGA